MSHTDIPTPSFRKPPVMETVLGVQFSPLEGFGITHFGLFAQRIRQEFPVVETRPPLEPSVEVFERSIAPSGVKWRLASAPELPRVWYIGDEGESGQRLIQLQTDRFMQNWRRKSLQEQEYPRYEKNRGEFLSQLRGFFQFVQQEGLGSVQANQCEVTYVNRIPLIEGMSAGEMARACLTPLGEAGSDTFLPPSPEEISLRMAYRIPDSRGRLRVVAEPRIDLETEEEILDLRLTARGKPESGSIDDILDWLDLGHRWVVNGFRSLTTSQMHDLWDIQKG